MNRFLAFRTKWNDIKTMDIVVSMPMMPLFCLFIAIETFVFFGLFEFSRFDGVFYCPMTMDFFWIFSCISFCSCSVFAIFCSLFVVPSLSFVESISGSFPVIFKPCFVLGRFLILSSVFFVFWLTMPSIRFISYIFRYFWFMVMFFLALFTPTLKAGWPIATWCKLRDALNFLAFRASLCYDWFRHGLIPCIKLCSGPSGSTLLPCGSSYYNTFFAEGK